MNPQNLQTLTHQLEVRTPIAKAVWGKNLQPLWLKLFGEKPSEKRHVLKEHGVVTPFTQDLHHFHGSENVLLQTIAKLSKIFQDLSSSTVVAIVKLRFAILTAKGRDLLPFLFHATVVPFIEAKLSKPITSNDNMTQLFSALVLTKDILDAVATF